MNEPLRQKRSALSWIFYPICLAATVALFRTAPLTGNGYIWLYGGIAVLILFACRPDSALYAWPVADGSAAKAICGMLAALVTIAACVLPMDDLPLWNGEQPDHRNQYELMAEAILDGRIDLVYGDEQALARLENPYDPAEREESGVPFHWDHAYYEGHYYMYFGVVPVFLVFLPYRLLTGAALTTFHATQIFAALSVAGIFVLFHLLARLFFKNLNYSVYLALSVAFSVMSLWYSAAESALYTTAITAAIAVEVWSLYFFVRAVWGETRENRQVALAGIGALLGALAFGCRPPIALANLLVIPMLAAFLRQRKFTPRLLGKLVLAALPYVIVAAGLMLYNYARFGDALEFGQKYQLTTADQTQFGVTLGEETAARLAGGIASNFFAVGEITAAFPYLKPASVFFNFPILLLYVGIVRPAVWRKLRQNGLALFTTGLLLVATLITSMDILWTPYLLERYRMDIYFLMGIGCFIVIGLWYETGTPVQRKRLRTSTLILSVVTVLASALYYMHTVGINYPDVVHAAAQTLHLDGP
nr:hypothetical protein [uncultured Agathobaculum sp.]